VTPLASLLRWAGSKRSSLPILSAYCSTGRNRYVEPFCGSAALFFHLRPERALLSDINDHLINFYSVLKHSAAEVYDYAVSIPRDAQTFYRTRADFNESKDPFIRACLFYYLNKNCFNGLFRTSKLGHFNVPFSPSRTGEYPPKTAFLEAADAIRSATFVCADFETVLFEHCRQGDFVFLDPPYSAATRYPFREYFPGCFMASDIGRLIRVLDILDARGVTFLATFSSSFVDDVAERCWQIDLIRTRRNISGFAGARKYVNDIVVTNRGIYGA
jgi:DNA adenine methylase